MVFAIKELTCNIMVKIMVKIIIKDVLIPVVLSRVIIVTVVVTSKGNFFWSCIVWYLGETKSRLAESNWKNLCIDNSNVLKV